MSQPKPYWIDCLWEKHECWSYDEVRAEPVKHGGRTLELLLPDYLPEFDVLTTAESGDLMFLIARTRPTDEDEEYEPDEPYGVSITARKIEGDRYSTVIWHEHYPYVFKYLGLEQQAAPPAGGTDG